MKKHLLLFLVAILCLGSPKIWAQPESSTAESPKWYLIQFLNGNEVLIPKGEGQEVQTQSLSESDNEFWRFEGNESTGYQIINKNGMRLYVNSAEKNQKIMASSTSQAHDRFTFSLTTNTNYAGGFEIHPSGNKAVSFNQWGGPATRRGIGLWDAGDQNNPLKFISAEDIENMSKISIIPYPNQITLEDGNVDLSSFTTITYYNDTTKLHAESFARQLEKASGIALTTKQQEGDAAEHAISLIYDNSLSAEEYTLEASGNIIKIKASSDAGIFYGLQTLKQLLPREFFGTLQNTTTKWCIPAISIQDKPALGYRGYMLDEARHFFGKEEVKRVLDIMSLYKMNRFHWHLSDDQGWRIEIPEYPNLTKIGSIRKGSLTNGLTNPRFIDDTEYGRGYWYSQEDIKEIVAYAKERHIEIVPELDFPGHMAAAIASYPEFACDTTISHEVQLVYADLLNVSNPEVITFIKCLVKNLASLFPYEYIHLGGDEVEFFKWEKNQGCVDLAKSEGLNNVKELQSWLVELIGTYAAEEFNKKAIVWDELLSQWNNNNQVKPTVMAWTNINKTTESANKGFLSIACPHDPLYFDMMQVPADQTSYNEDYYGGWNEGKVNSVERIYNFNPLSALPANQKEMCLGVQGNMWTETTVNAAMLEYQLLPRMLSLAEIGWLDNSKKNWIGFRKRLQSHDDIFENLSLNYAKHYFEETPQSETEQTISDAEMLLSNSIKGGAGYPEASIYESLEQSLSAFMNDSENENLLAELKTAIQNFKNAPLVMPEAGKTYQIVSAASYYKTKYEGSTMYYSDDNTVRFHYTPQCEPEELWTFEKDGNNWILKNYLNGMTMKMGAYNTIVEMSEKESTPIRIDKATVALNHNGTTIDYVPGAVIFSDIKTYSPNQTGSCKRLSAEPDGYLYDKDVPTLCQSATWKLVEVQDFSIQLQGLVKKAELTIIRSTPNEPGEPTQEALDYLQKELIEAAQKEQDQGPVTEDTYKKYVEIYKKYLAMPVTSLINMLSEDIYYQIRNAQLTDYYAGVNNSNQIIRSDNSINDKNLWFIKKNPNGSISIFNKYTKKPAYVYSSGDGQSLRADFSGSGITNWTIEKHRNNDTRNGMSIKEPTNQYSWYTDGNTDKVTTKDKRLNPSIWHFIKTNIQVEEDPTGITDITDNGQTPAETKYYDVSGKQISKFRKNQIYINSNKQKVLINQ